MTVELGWFLEMRMSRKLDVVTLTGEEYDALNYQIEDLRNVLRKLVEHDVTYWDSKGEVRHDVGTSQAEAMAIFREARQLLTPNALGNRLPATGAAKEGEEG